MYKPLAGKDIVLGKTYLIRCSSDKGPATIVEPLIHESNPNVFRIRCHMKNGVCEHSTSLCLIRTEHILAPYNSENILGNFPKKEGEL